MPGRGHSSTERDVRADGPPFSFPGAKIVPVLAVVAIIAILTQSAISDSQVGSDTRAGLRIGGIVIIVASVLYFLRAKFRSTAHPE